MVTPTNTIRMAGESGKALPIKMELTLARVRAATCPPGKGRVWLYDRRQGGLALMVTESGAKSYYFQKKINGRVSKVRIAGVDEIALDAARATVAEWCGGVPKGIDPMQARRAGREEMTMAELFEYYMQNHARLHKRTSREDQQKFDLYMDGWGTRKIGTISRQDIQSLHARIGKETPYAANRLLSLLHKVFGVALDLGLEKNPADRIRKFAESSRERFVGPDEMPRLLAAIDKEEEPFNDFFKLALLTGARRSNLLSMRWDELDMNAKVWTIPAEKAKAGKIIRVPLADEAVAILNERIKARKPDAEWVFPSNKGRSPHIAEPKFAWQRILDRAEIEGLRIHDLRRTAGSWMAAAGASLPVIGKMLGHSNQATTQIYARLNVEPVRVAIQSAASAMMATATPATTGAAASALTTKPKKAKS